MMTDPNYQELTIDERIEQENENLSELQSRWDNAIEKLKPYFGIEEEFETPNDLLRSLESKTLSEFNMDDRPVALGFAGPGGAGKGTVREQLMDEVKTLPGVNSTTRERREYEVDGVHYNFVTTEDFASGVTLTEESKEEIAKLLGEEKSDKLTSEMLDRLGKKMEDENMVDGITLTVEKGSSYLNLTYRPGRGWYGVSTDTFDGLKKGDIITLEESGPNLVLIGDSINKEELNYSLVYILPPQPIAETMARRALSRDGIDQPSEKLFSTIGERQVNEFETMVDLLLKHNVPFILLVNDDVLPSKDGKVITRTGEELIKKMR